MSKKYVIGIDIGGSTTKIVGFDEEKKLVAPMFVHAEDQLTSIYGAFGKFSTGTWETCRRETDGRSRRSP